MSRHARLFIALWPDEALRDSIAQAQGRWSWPSRAALVKAAKLHATLHFLGNVEVARVPELSAAMQVPFAPFEAVFDAHRVWPGGIAVIECTQPPPQLLRLHAAIGAALRSSRFETEERRYRPHITLARRALDAKPPQDAGAMTWKADAGYALVQSIAGVGYEIIARSTRP